MTDTFGYLEDRVETQRKWHSANATWHKRRFYAVEIVTLVAGALIPVVNVLDMLPQTWLRVVSVLLATIIVLATGLGRLYKFQETWLNYRMVAEALKREKEYYLYGIGDYALLRSDNARNRRLVERVEEILASTTNQFIAIHQAQQSQTQPQAAVVSPEVQPH